MMASFDAEDGLEGMLYGYMIVEHGRDLPVVHYAYLKEAYRGQRIGILRALFKAGGIDPLQPFWFTHKTRYGARALKKAPWAAKFNPRLARYERRANGRAEARP